MKIDKRSMLLIVAVLISLVQAGFAGVMHFARGTVERELSSDRSNLQLLQNRRSKMDDEVAPPVESTPEPTPEPRPDSKLKLLDGPDIVGTLQIVQKMGDDAGINFEILHPQPPQVAGVQQFSIAGRGVPEQFCAFIASLEQCDRLIVVESGSLLPSGDFTIAFKLVLMTFYRTEIK